MQGYLPIPWLVLQSIAAQIGLVVFKRHRQRTAFYQHHFGALHRRRFDPALQASPSTFVPPSHLHRRPSRAIPPSLSYLKRTYMRLRDERTECTTQPFIDRSLRTDGLRIQTLPRGTRRDGCRLYFLTRPPQKLKYRVLHTSLNVFSSGQLVDVDWIVGGRWLARLPSTNPTKPTTLRYSVVRPYCSDLGVPFLATDFAPVRSCVRAFVFFM